MNLQVTPRANAPPSNSRIHLRRLDTNNNVHFLAFCLSTLVNAMLDILQKICPAWILRWIRWCPSSPQSLEIAEKEVLKSQSQLSFNFQRPYSVCFVNIGPCWEKEDNFVWTLHMKSDVTPEKTPIVLLHGFGTGIGLWIANLDSLSTGHPLYAIDVLGFGRSSRPTYSTDESEAEQQFVTSIEMWRKAVGLEKMLFVGHSTGGFLATSYAISHPEHVDLLILADPWGFPEPTISFVHKYDIPSWVKFVTTFLQGFNLLAALRASGPLGPYLVDSFRHDVQRKFTKRLKDSKCMTNYLFHCNAQTPSGEVGFKAMTDKSGWAKFPMICRMSQLYWRIPIVFIYGSRCTMRQPALQIKYSRLDSYVDVQVIENSGHHMYADQPEQFNALVNRVCERFENKQLS